MAAEPDWQEQEQALERQQHGAGTVQRKGFGSEELEVTGETAGSILAAQARAMVEARFVMALRRPRDWDDVRAKLLRACERPGFAGDPESKQQLWGAAWYRKPVGDGVEGFSIRFAEEAMRCMGNLDIQTVTVYDDAQKRILTVVVTDLETNVGLPTSIVVDKTVERKKLRRGDQPIRTRMNSYGDQIYIMPATDDDVFQKQQSAASKAIRNGILRLLPGDIQAECRRRIMEIRFGDAAKDPDKVKREISDAFGKLNVLPSGLKLFLGHELSESTPAELTALRALYKAIANGEITWKDALADALGEDGEDKPKNGKEAADQLAQKLKAERQGHAEADSSNEAQNGPPGAPGPTQATDSPSDEKGQESPEGRSEGEAALSGPIDDLVGKQKSGLLDAFQALGDVKGMNIAKDTLEAIAGTRAPAKVKEKDLGLAIAELNRKRLEK